MQKKNKASAENERARYLKAIESVARKRVQKREQNKVISFINIFYEMSASDLFQRRTAEALFDVAHACWKSIQVRRPGKTVLEVLGKGQASAQFAVVRTNMEDMPFLVDSIGMAIREAGLSVDWSVHPIMDIRRDSRGNLKNIYSLRVTEGDPQRAIESIIHMEFDPPDSEEACDQLRQSIESVLADVRISVSDYAAMREQLHGAAEHLRVVPQGGDKDEFSEAREFLLWLDNHHFSLLGFAESKSEVGAGGKGRFRTVPGAGLGLLRKGGQFSDGSSLIAPKEELDKYASSPRVVVFTKANSRSPIHHPEFLDVISVKRFRANGTTAGTWRFVGLFSSEVYIEKLENIPLIRRKAQHVIDSAPFPDESHAAKQLREILHTLPRDELIQSNEDELFEMCMGILALRDRHQLRLFLRRDRYGRFYSALIYLPRDRYSPRFRKLVSEELRSICSSMAVDANVQFLRGGLARLHCMVRTEPGFSIGIKKSEVEQRLINVTQSWHDQVLQRVPAKELKGDAAALIQAFPAEYTAAIKADEAATDIAFLTRLDENERILPRLSRDAEKGDVRLKLYLLGDAISLSAIMPTLENFGLGIISQVPAELRLPNQPSRWIQQFDVEIPTLAGKISDDHSALFKKFEDALIATWQGQYEDDALNRLVLSADLDAREVLCLRVILKYLIQTGLPYSGSYMAHLMYEHAEIAGLLVDIFGNRFSPDVPERDRESKARTLQSEIDKLLDQVASLDSDRVLRSFLGVIKACLRTNYYQPSEDGSRKRYVSIKLDPKAVPELPQPLPMYEIFVYAPEMEGIHLRGGKVARGGLRWSDRQQDFRTEVLGLMKAQQVKNTIIVPVGAKGGFVVKKGDSSNRESWLKTGIECYKTFLRGLLDVTDNRVGSKIVPPKNVVRYDEDDPYLVVAADKGTATFSDIANGISEDYGHWLGDAFASGGSVGYDHKQMGITARGAWESVKRHFRELGTDIQSEAFTVAGVGDMSGDVFGNGMLLSRHIRLFAAFDHRHIFLDPSPDEAKSFKERQRMFALPRSSWEDYDSKLISKGGGVFPRSAKSIKLTPEIQKVLGVSSASMKPQELISAILKAPVDLFWNGGIGTYVKSKRESHQDCGDRANDGLRVNGSELRCKVIGEGGNLGCTQLGRIEFSMHGGRINTDFIDNAGGVHSSDREVNIKIPLNQLVAEKRWTVAKRNKLLASMTDDIADIVLQDSYVQSAAISLLERNAVARMDENVNLMHSLEREGRLSRAVEFLPDDESLNERLAQKRGLVRPELSVLLAYSKMSIFDALLASDVPDDPFFESMLLQDFPNKMVKAAQSSLVDHRLRREIISTILSNALVNRVGAAFASRFSADHGMSLAEVVKAFSIASELIGAETLWADIEALDHKIPTEAQYKLLEMVAGPLKNIAAYIASSGYVDFPVADSINKFGPILKELEPMLPKLFPASYRHFWDQYVEQVRSIGAPEALTKKLATAVFFRQLVDIAALADQSRLSLDTVASTFFHVGDHFNLTWILGAITSLHVHGKWPALARANLRDDANRAHQLVVRKVLTAKGKTPEDKFKAWISKNKRPAAFAKQRISELKAVASLDFLTVTVAVRELSKLNLA